MHHYLDKQRKKMSQSISHLLVGYLVSLFSFCCKKLCLFIVKVFKHMHAFTEKSSLNQIFENVFNFLSIRKNVKCIWNFFLLKILVTRIVFLNQYYFAIEHFSYKDSLSWKTRGLLTFSGFVFCCVLNTQLIKDLKKYIYLNLEMYIFF